jgi:hypothetical protein
LGADQPKVTDIDVVATDGDRDQVGVRAKRVELAGWWWPGRTGCGAVMLSVLAPPQLTSV